MNTGSFKGIKRPRHGVDHPPHLAPLLKKEYRYTCTAPLFLHGSLEGEIYHYLLLEAPVKKTHNPSLTTCSRTISNKNISGSYLPLIWVHPLQLWWVLKVSWWYLPYTVTTEWVVSVRCGHPSACWPGTIVICNDLFSHQVLEHGLLIVHLPVAPGTLKLGWWFHHF